MADLYYGARRGDKTSKYEKMMLILKAMSNVGSSASSIGQWLNKSEEAERFRRMFEWKKEDRQELMKDQEQLDLLEEKKAEVLERDGELSTKGISTRGLEPKMRNKLRDWMADLKQQRLLREDQRAKIEKKNMQDIAQGKMYKTMSRNLVEAADGEFASTLYADLPPQQKFMLLQHKMELKDKADQEEAMNFIMDAMKTGKPIDTAMDEVPEDLKKHLPTVLQEIGKTPGAREQAIQSTGQKDWDALKTEFQDTVNTATQGDAKTPGLARAEAESFAAERTFSKAKTLLRDDPAWIEIQKKIAEDPSAENLKKAQDVARYRLSGVSSKVYDKAQEADVLNAVDRWFPDRLDTPEVETPKVKFSEQVQQMAADGELSSYAGVLGLLGEKGYDPKKYEAFAKKQVERLKKDLTKKTLTRPQREETLMRLIESQVGSFDESQYPYVTGGGVYPPNKPGVFIENEGLIPAWKGEGVATPTVKKGSDGIRPPRYQGTPEYQGLPPALESTPGLAARLQTMRALGKEYRAPTIEAEDIAPFYRRADTTDSMKDAIEARMQNVFDPQAYRRMMIEFLENEYLNE